VTGPELLTPARADEYRDFLLQDPRNLIYASLEFRDFLTAVVPGEPQYLIARESSRIVGALPCFRVVRPGLGTVMNSLPWYGSHGGCTLSPQAPEGTRHYLLDGYLALAGGADVLSSTLIMPPFEQPHLDEYRERLRPVATDVRIGQITELPADCPDLPAKLEMSLAQKTRNLMRKALKQGFRLECDDTDRAWRFLHDTHAENMTAIGGAAKPWAHFAALRAKLPHGWRRVLVATYKGEPVAALLLLYFNRTVEYLTPVIQQAYRPLQPLSFLIWHGMLDAVRSGFRWWNWGGTWASQATLHHFKAGWGARDHPYTYLITASPSSVALLKAHRERLPREFPYCYTYPYHLLA